MKIYIVFAMSLIASLGCKGHLGEKEDRLETSKVFIDYLYADDTTNMIKMMSNRDEVASMVNDISFLYKELHMYRKPTSEDYSMTEYPSGGYKRTEVSIPIFRASHGDTISPFLNVDLVLIYGPLDITPTGTIGATLVKSDLNPDDRNIRIPLKPLSRLLDGNDSSETDKSK